MFDVAVTYLLRETSEGVQVLLGRKRTGIGTGKFVGPGGKLEPGEDPETAAVREVHEEVGLRVRREDLEPIATLRYAFPHRPAWSQRSTAFLTRRFEGEVVPSRELHAKWHPLDALPLERMWADARLWLPRALSGEFVDADCAYAEDNDSVESWVERP